MLSLRGFTSVTTELLPAGLLTRTASDLGTVLGGMAGPALAVLGLSGLLGVAMAGRVPRWCLYTGLLLGPVLMLAGFLGLTVLPQNVVVAIVLLGIWGIGYAAAAVFNQQVILVVGHRAPETVTSVSVVIAARRSPRRTCRRHVGVAWVPLTGAIFAAASAALLIGLRSFLPARRSKAVG